MLPRSPRPARTRPHRRPSRERSRERPRRLREADRPVTGLLAGGHRGRRLHDEPACVSRSPDHRADSNAVQQHRATVARPPVGRRGRGSALRPRARVRAPPPMYTQAPYERRASAWTVRPSASLGMVKEAFEPSGPFARVIRDPEPLGGREPEPEPDVPLRSPRSAARKLSCSGARCRGVCGFRTIE